MKIGAPFESGSPEFSLAIEGDVLKPRRIRDRDCPEIDDSSPHREVFPDHALNRCPEERQPLITEVEFVDVIPEAEFTKFCTDELEGFI
ncbi:MULTISPECIES: hypothetical protein [Haloferax]|uniref:hypothetical protein n=1 Tax=Haloferax TaxID=2251 RepID=UPI001784BD4C|nr:MULTISPECIES: hypothetical protein [Haloferax]